MPLKEPESMDELLYFTRRALEGAKGGKVMAWVSRQNCTKCGKGLMGKPLDDKTGKPKIRAKEYVCPECRHTVEKKEYEETLTADIKYTCPECGFEGETQVPFKRKKVQGVDALPFNCGKCNARILVTKKMKGIKEKD